MIFADPSPKEVLKSLNIVRIGDPTLEDLLDSTHELVKLAGVMDWKAFDDRFGNFFKNERGRPPIKTRAVVGVLYLKHTYNLSDDEVIASGIEDRPKFLKEEPTYFPKVSVNRCCISSYLEARVAPRRHALAKAVATSILPFAVRCVFQGLHGGIKITNGASDADVLF